MLKNTLTWCFQSTQEKGETRDKEVRSQDGIAKWLPEDFSFLSPNLIGFPPDWGGVKGWGL